MKNANTQVPANAALSRDPKAVDARKLWQRPTLNRLDASYANANATITDDLTTGS